jgi:hypothetical protein
MKKIELGGKIEVGWNYYLKHVKSKSLIKVENIINSPIL